MFLQAAKAASGFLVIPLHVCQAYHVPSLTLGRKLNASSNRAAYSNLQAVQISQIGHNSPFTHKGKKIHLKKLQQCVFLFTKRTDFPL